MIYINIYTLQMQLKIPLKWSFTGGALAWPTVWRGEPISSSGREGCREGEAPACGLTSRDPWPRVVGFGRVLGSKSLEIWRN